MECPWCYKEVEVKKGFCPACGKEIFQEAELEAESMGLEPELELGLEPELEEADVERAIEEHFKCAKCGCESCRLNEVAMTGTGLSKLMDIQHNHYLFVTCRRCGFVEVYDPDVLRGYPSGRLSTILDIIF